MYDYITIEHIKKTGKVAFAKNWLEILTDLILPAIIIFMPIVAFFKYGIKDNILLITYIVIFMIGLFLLYFTIKKIKYYSSFLRITTRNNVTENIEWFQKNIESILKVRSGQIFETDKMAIIHTKMSLFSWGEIVTLIFDGNDVLINSRNRATTLSLYHDKKNINAIVESIKFN